MAKGSVYPSERQCFQDPETGVTVHRLTGYLCHNNHLYFTHRPYYAGGRKMVFHSDRGNARNLFGLNLDSGEIQQLTGFESGVAGVSPFHACVNPVKAEAYFWVEKTLHAIDLGDLSEHRLWEYPEDVLCGMPNCTADGRFVCYYLCPDLSRELPVDIVHGHVRPEAYLAAHPRCQIARIPTSGGEPEVVWEEDNWLGHVNTSPVDPNLLTFCHEGPWPLVKQRIWGLNLKTEAAWKIRPETEGVIIGHEYWFADGSRIGYHGRLAQTGPLWGHADPLGGDFEEHPMPRASMHLHSLGRELLLSDGTAQDPYLRLWRWNGTGYEGRLLCSHRCSFHTQRLHVHPAMTPDGKGVIFTSDLNGYGNIYYLEFPEFNSLPSSEAANR